MERVNLTQCLIGLVLRQSPDYGKRLIKRLYKELSQKAMPQFEAKNLLSQIEKSPAYDQYRLSLVRPILMDLANLMPTMQRPDLTHLFINMGQSGVSLSSRQYVLNQYKGVS